MSNKKEADRATDQVFILGATRAMRLREIQVRLSKLEMAGVMLTHEDADHVITMKRRIIEAWVKHNALTAEDRAGIIVAPHHGAGEALPDVPSGAETVVSYVCTPDRLEAVLGDLQRNFIRRAIKHGEKAARRWYWWQTARTVAAFGVQIVVRVVMLRALLEKLGL